MNIGLRVLAFVVDMFICQFLLSVGLIGISIFGMAPALYYDDPAYWEEQAAMESAVDENGWADEEGTADEYDYGNGNGSMPLPFLFFPLMMPLTMGLYFVGPVLYFALPTGIWGRTPGKLIFRIKVSDRFGHAPGILRALGREALKFIAVATGFGIFFSLFQVIQTGEVWYDSLCETEVDGGSLVRLTETQKNWRKYQKARR